MKYTKVKNSSASPRSNTNIPKLFNVRSEICVFPRSNSIIRLKGFYVGIQAIKSEFLKINSSYPTEFIIFQGQELSQPHLHRPKS